MEYNIIYITRLSDGSWEHEHKLLGGIKENNLGDCIKNIIENWNSRIIMVQPVGSGWNWYDEKEN